MVVGYNKYAIRIIIQNRALLNYIVWYNLQHLMERQQTRYTPQKNEGTVFEGLYHNLSQRTQLIYCDNLTNLILFLFLNLRE